MNYRIILLGGTILLAGCTTITGTISKLTGGTGNWTPAQQAYFLVESGIAAENVATQVEGTVGLSAADVADIKVGKQALGAAITAQATVLATGGSTSAQAQAGAVAAGVSAINNLASVLTAKHGSSADLKAMAVATGIDALEQIPALIGYAESLNSGLDPTTVDASSSTGLTFLAEATAALKTASAN